MPKKITVALAGNPNSGKTTIFNSLTGARQHVGNYPGVTVEKKEGTCKVEKFDIKIIDLPGTYSLSANSIEERVARNFIIEGKPDIVVNVLDASIIERNLYLSTQLLELEVPVILVLNMSDEAKKKGIRFDLKRLSELLGVPIIETVAHKGQGIKELIEMIQVIASCKPDRDGSKVYYGQDVEKELREIEKLIRKESLLKEKYPLRWLAIKLLEQDAEMWAKVDSSRIKTQVRISGDHLKRLFKEEPEILIADQRYGFISGACQEAVKNTVEARHEISDRIDILLTNQFLGFPIFLGMMYLVFYFTFTLGNPVMQVIERLFAWLSMLITNWWPAGSNSPIQSLLVDGIIGGVGGVVVFLPNIIFLFLAISLLEDTGYMARAAFLMDRLMHKIGLHGKSFIPLLLGFGCSVPAIMATRTLENERDRLTTMLVIPLISCGARLPIYTLIAPAFFPKAWQAPVVMIIYLIGISLSVSAAKLLRLTLFKGESMPFVMELPPYRMPTVYSMLLHTWNKAWLYLKKAGTVILAISIVLWALTSYPKRPAHPEQPIHSSLAVSEQAESVPQAEDLAYSFAGRIGRVLEAPFSLLGFDWRIATALIGAFAAKEVFVAQLGIVYAVGGDGKASQSLREKLRRNYSPLVGFCIMLFCLISLPCVATLATIRQESGSWKWAFYQAAGLTVLAYIITLFVYQSGKFLGIGI